MSILIFSTPICCHCVFVTKFKHKFSFQIKRSLVKTMEVLPAKTLAMEEKAADKPTKSRKRQGKGSRVSNEEKFRNRRNKEVDSKNLHDINVRLGLITEDETGQLASVIDNIDLSPQPRAIPLTVTTRGVGITTAIHYSRVETTWNLRAIEEIATIHQVYRVHLWLTIFKLYLAQQEQSEPRNGHDILMRVDLADQIRELLLTITEIPSLLSMIFDSIGKIETNGAVYHCGIAQQPGAADLAEYRSLVILPSNIRELLVLNNFGNTYIGIIRNGW